MIAGHFGLAAAVKARARPVPLWTLMLACQWLDVVFVPLLLAGVERLEPVAGAAQGAYGQAIIHADYTHSLVGALVLSAGFGAVAAIRYGRSSGIILALVSFSHWLLDLIVHRPDLPLLPLLPGGAGGVRLGLGLWRVPAAAATLELAIVVIGGALYWRAARGVAGTDATQARRAVRCGAAVLVAGVLTLGLNLAGL
ncbi:MAG TPA: hypothetical protein VHW23_08655 [Kofleriaceae bacterium]|nr:hypothetical protein [Kofleriaceae bacterium]